MDASDELAYLHNSSPPGVKRAFRRQGYFRVEGRALEAKEGSCWGDPLFGGKIQEG